MLPDDAYLFVETQKDILIIDIAKRYGRTVVSGKFIPYKVEDMVEAPIIHWKYPNLYLGTFVSQKLYPNRKLSKSGKIQLIIANGEETLFGDAKDRPPKINPNFEKWFNK